ncbi:hypothetical protein [Salmonirosea aquatica]|uniref:Uncharacterized protein n=1 Tax=Salmonirosea aquatica TaxID=2654236 RepID=A0A7C9FET7_9BACT|nr:hypothetical protein [Cytophagaceae bacterium SJW1-29]
MANLSAQEANRLANNFLGLAQSIGDFRFNNWNVLTIDENQRMGDLQWSILNYGEDILALSTQLVVEDSKQSLEEINDISTEIKATINTIQQIQKGINVATSIVVLGGAIVSKNPQAIIDALKGVVESFNT